MKISSYLSIGLCVLICVGCDQIAARLFGAKNPIAGDAKPNEAILEPTVRAVGSGTRPENFRVQEKPSGSNARENYPQEQSSTLLKQSTNRTGGSSVEESGGQALGSTVAPLDSVPGSLPEARSTIGVSTERGKALSPSVSISDESMSIELDSNSSRIRIGPLQSR